LSSSEQQYFVWDTASHSAKLQDMLEICLGMALIAAKLSVTVHT